MNKEKINLCQEIGHFFGCYFEENGQMCIDNGEEVFRYNTPDELLADWVETLIQSHIAPEGFSNNWEKEILFIYTNCMKKHPVGVRKVEGKKGTVWNAYYDVPNPNYPHYKAVHLGTYSSLIDAIWARRLYLEEDIAGIDTNTDEGLKIAIEKANERRLKAKEKSKEAKSALNCAVVCTYPDKDVAVYLFKDIEKAKKFLMDNYNETVKLTEESEGDISGFVNRDETYARITFIPDDLDSDNETTEFRIGKIYN